MNTLLDINRLPSTVTATNFGPFPMSEEFVTADSATLASIANGMNSLTGRHISIGGAQEEFEGRNDLPGQIVASYLGAVAGHAEALEVDWYVEQDENSPLIRVAAALAVKKYAEGPMHRDRDFGDRAGMGVRFMLVNQNPTDVGGMEPSRPGDIVMTVHGRTWHNAPAISGSRKHPRLRLGVDMFTTDPDAKMEVE